MSDPTSPPPHAAAPTQPHVRRGPGSRVSRETDGLARGAKDGIDDGPDQPPVSRETPVPFLTRLTLLPIRAYRRLISPLVGPRCRYYPSCSSYAEQAVRQFGPLRGILLAAWRVLRCNPLSDGGFDPLSQRRFFRPAEPSRPDTH